MGGTATGSAAEDPPLPSKPQLPSPVRPRQNSWNPAEDPPLPEPGAPPPQPPEPIPSAIYAAAAAQREEPKKTGTVIWFHPIKNQGFIKPDDGSRGHLGPRRRCPARGRPQER